MVGILRAGQWDCSEERLNDVYSDHRILFQLFRALFVLCKLLIKAGASSLALVGILHVRMCSLSFITSIITGSQRIVV